MSNARVRTTVAIAADLLDAVDSAIREGIARSRNELVNLALQNQLAASRREAIDAAFAGMAQDADYRREALEIASELESADAESLRLGASGSSRAHPAVPFERLVCAL